MILDVISRSAVDAAQLPDEVVGLLAGLPPGETLTVLRDGEPIATITGAGRSGPLEGTVIRPTTPHWDADQHQSGHQAPHAPQAPRTRDEHVTVVATAMKLSQAARGKLSADLGSDYIVLDLDDAPETAEVLLVPPISLQLLDSLRDRFPAARVILAELEDQELGVDYRGPVQRMIDAGVEAYLTSTALPRLARQLDQAVTRRTELTAGSSRLEPRWESRLEIGPPGSD
jgi:hypothetical protein